MELHPCSLVATTMEKMITLIFGLLFICLFFFTRLRERRARLLLAGLPSKPCLPFVGNFYQLFGGSKVLLHQVNELCEIAEKHDKPVVVWAGSHPIILLCKPENVKLVTNAFVEKPYFYDFAKPLIGDGIFSAPGSLWKRNIKKIVGSGSFTKAAVNTYQEKLSSCADKLVDQLRQKAGQGPFDATEIVVMTTLNALCQTVLGSDFSSEPDFVRRYHDAQTRCLDLMVNRGLNLLLHPDLVFQWTTMYKELLENVAVIHDVTNTVMSQINQQREDMKKPDNFGKSLPKSFYENLLKLHQVDPSFTMEQVMSEIHTIILGGQKTVTATLVFVFLTIGHYAEVQKRLHEEIKSIYGGSTRPVTTADLARMPYCEAVINETLRLYPPGPVVLRCADSDLTLESCTIPKGATCAIGVWGLNRSRRLWGPDAHQFRPERWLQPGCPGNSIAFAPFSCGKRACIGRNYSISILKTLVAQCVRELEFKSDITQMELKVDVVLKPVSNYFIQVQTRE